MTNIVEKVARAMYERGNSLQEAARVALEVVLSDLEKPSQVMLVAHGQALCKLIRSIPQEERTARWGRPRPGRGYFVPEYEKAAARFSAMISAYAKEQGVEVNER